VLEVRRFNVGDGPAAFLILIVGAIVCVAAIMVELAYSPRWVVHLVSLPVLVALTLGGLRIGKAMLIFLEYRQKAGEGRLGR